VTSAHDDKPSATEVGNYFISNYPPYSFWNETHVPALLERLEQAPPTDVGPFGVYLHLPFCRKRCDFCYYKVYTDKNAKEIRAYLDALLAEAEHAASRPYIAGRRPVLFYFGGGTPSYLSIAQLDELFTGLRRIFSFDATEEITFECEPGTLQESKIAWLREAGVTRLSLGVENFDPEILEVNNRAHRAKEIFTAYEKARSVDFPQLNLDLISGMVGENDANWRDCIAKTIALRPDSVTIYQMELPYNTTISRRMLDGEEAPVADWETKRRWTKEAFAELEKAGYIISATNTAILGPDVRFRYREALFGGVDLLGLGVSSFSHLGGFHAQNEHQIGPYVDRVERGELPILRALPLPDDERLIREFILQMKVGLIETAAFREKFGVDVTERFAEPLAKHAAEGHLRVEPERIVLSRDGLLAVDGLLPDYFKEEHRGARYA